jgi:hypothetical protein
MEDALFNLYLISALFMPPLFIGIWFFGLRRYINKKGKTTISAANWGLSMWADWTVAWEIGRAEGKLPLSVKVFLALQLLALLEIIAAFVL